MLTPGEELLSRRVRDKQAGHGHCLGCNFELVGHDRDTGFPRRWCEHCKLRQQTEKARAVAASGQGSAAKRDERLRKDGLDNLDRLMRGEPIEPVKP